MLPGVQSTNAGLYRHSEDQRDFQNVTKKLSSKERILIPGRMQVLTDTVKHPLKEESRFLIFHPIPTEGSAPGGGGGYASRFQNAQHKMDEIPAWDSGGWNFLDLCTTENFSAEFSRLRVDHFMHIEKRA